MNTKKCLWVTILSLFLTFNLCFWILYITQPMTKDNTYETHIRVKEVSTNCANHRGTDLIFVTTEDDCYIVDTTWRNEIETEKLAEIIRSLSGSVKISVWEHFPKYLFRSDGGVFQCKQIVHMSSDILDVIDISEFNSYQRGERIAGVLGAGGILISVIFANLFMWFILKK